MKSDILFYELFQSHPHVFFELMQIIPTCPYRFESITVKTTEKRIDGVFEPTQVGHPIYFVEVQASPDKTIYQRVARETATYFEQRPDLIETEWFAMVLWLDQANDDAGFGHIPIRDNAQKQRIFSWDLVETLQKLPQSSLSVTVLSPFLVDTEQEIRHNLEAWLKQIHQSPQLDLMVQHRLVEVLLQFIEQKFKTLNYKELAKMLKLTPFRETLSYRETFEEDVKEYSITILLQQIQHKFRFAPSTLAKLESQLRQLPLKALKELFVEILDLETLREINVWIKAHGSSANETALPHLPTAA